MPRIFRVKAYVNSECRSQDLAAFLCSFAYEVRGKTASRELVWSRGPAFSLPIGGTWLPMTSSDGVTWPKQKTPYIFVESDTVPKFHLEPWPSKMSEAIGHLEYRQPFFTQSKLTLEIYAEDESTEEIHQIFEQTWSPDVTAHQPAD